MRPYQTVISLTNNLSNLLPIGTLHFYDLPFNKSDLGGIPVSHHNSWKWLDIDFLNYICNNSMNHILNHIRFLVTFRFIMTTYKVIKCRGMTIAKVRIYAVPFDMAGSRHILEWRAARPKKYDVERNFKTAWHELVRCMDYSEGNWAGFDLSQGILLVSVRPVEATSSQKSPPNSGETPINSGKIGGRVPKSLEMKLDDSNYHINRWSNNLPYIPPKPSANTTTKLQQIYADIPSPDITKYYTKSITKDFKNLVPSPEEIIVSLVHNMSEGNTSIPGVKTQLYPFQIKSLSRMYEKESNPDKTVVPNFIELKTPTKQPYYFDLTTSGFFLKPEVFHLPRGGILAENMGLGKTLICLSLICLTKWEMSRLPTDYLIFNMAPSESIRMRSLAEICKKCITKNSLPWKYYTSELPDSVIKYLNRSPGYFRIPLDNSEYITPFSVKRSRRSERLKLLDQELPMEGKHYRTLYYCNTTLIVVPDNLFHQWNTELKKHIEPEYLKKLFISNQFKKRLVTENGEFIRDVPYDPTYLLKFDLVVISLSILSRQLDEYNDSSLLKVFWKRLIIDEGHSMNSKSSRAGLLCRDMHAERRWAVTGTPTSGLTQLHMEEEEHQLSNKYVVKNSFNEKDDLVKLGNIISNFLKIEPFHSQPKLWGSNMVRPLMTNVYGSTKSFANLLNSIVIRHSLDEVERDIKLPQLHHVSVFLKPSYHNKLAINIFTAVLAVNAVSSERKDIDYMFHPNNRQQLRRLITNLQRATFHWSGFKQDDIETLISICRKSLEKKKSNGKPVYNQTDTELLKKSLEIAVNALNNPRWRTTALIHEMNYFVAGLPDIFTKTFGTGVVESLQNGSHNDLGVFGAPHINALQEFFYKNRFMDMNDDVKLVEKLEEVSKPFWANYWKHTMKQNNDKFNKQDEDYGDLQERIMSSVKPGVSVPVSPKRAPVSPKRVMNSPKRVTNSPKKPPNSPKKPPNSPKKPPSPHKNTRKPPQDFTSSKNELSRENGDGLKITNQINTLHSLAKHNISYDSVRNALILGTASTKLSYLASKLLENQHLHVKSIVFFEFEDSAYYLTELLDILGVNYILYATFINTSQRAENLSEFSRFPSEKDGGITLVMDLRLAAHGLTIIAATKVYFISPVWQRSVEAQAIKRAHRIGQTNEVYVETLVLVDTLEEEIYNKRLSSATTDDNKKKYVIDDTGMQDFILRHNFLPMDDSQPEYAPFEAPTTINSNFLREDLDPSALNVHEDVVENWKRRWKIYLFNKDNLGKLNSAKNQKITREFMKDQFIKNMVEDEVEEVETVAREPKRKKVRF